MPSTLAVWVRFPPRQASVSQMSPHSTAAIVWPTSFRTRSISSGEKPAERRKSFATGGALWRTTSGITASREDRASSLKPSNRDAAPLPEHERAPDMVNEFLKRPAGKRRGGFSVVRGKGCPHKRQQRGASNVPPPPFTPASTNASGQAGASVHELQNGSSTGELTRRIVICRADNLNGTFAQRIADQTKGPK